MWYFTLHDYCFLIAVLFQDKARLHAHVAELEAKAKRLQDIYNRVVSTTENTVLASSVYKDVVEIIAQARNKTNIALIEAKSAQKLSSGRVGKLQANYFE